MQKILSFDPSGRKSSVQKFREAFESLLQNTPQDSSQVHYILIIRIFGFDKLITLTDLESSNVIIEQLAKPIRCALREQDILFRIGDRDFGLILPYMRNRSIVMLAANKILSSVQSYCKENISWICGCFIGASAFPNNMQDSSTAISNAYMAMLIAEQTNKPFIDYESSSAHKIRDGIIIEAELSSSLLHDEMEFHLQPQLCLQSNTITGVEVLLRWNNNPIIGTVPPAIFIPIAEESGFIDELTDWVADRALCSCARIQADYPGRTFSINLSTRTLKRTDLTHFIADIIELWCVPAETVILEITETTLMDEPINAKNKLCALKDVGVRISIDDFGTGYSSLAYLSNLPIDEIKIDKSFVRDLAINSSNQKIVKTIIDLAKNFELEVVAEGVEDFDSLELLKAFGCHKAQGYLIAKPMPETDFINFMSGWKKASLKSINIYADPKDGLP